MDSYTLKKHSGTGELHLFVGRFNPPNSAHPCTSHSVSICEKMKFADSERNIFSCQKEGEARTKCAEVGRAVCGICVSSLYATY